MGTVDRLIICLAVRLKKRFFFSPFLSFLSLSVGPIEMNAYRVHV